MSKRRELVDGKLQCRQCSEWKATEEFHTNRKDFHGKASYCKPCTNEKAKARHAQVRSPGCEGYEDYQETRRSRIYRIKYGLTLQEVRHRLAEQGGLCAICKEELKEESHGYHVDHCHTNQHVRGILCARCNLGLGYFLDNEQRLQGAIEYLKLDKERQECQTQSQL